MATKNVDVKSKRCPHCNGTELVCRLHKQCCSKCAARGDHGGSIEDM